MIIGMVGDVMVGRGVGQEIRRRDPASFWGDTLPLLHSADVLIAGLECAITTATTPWTKTPKVFHFRAPPEATAVLQTAGVRMVSLANNHVLDFDVPGLLDTLDHLDAAGIAHAGAGRNLAEARQPAVVDANGMRVGMIAGTDNEPAWAATATEPGMSYLPIDPSPTTLDIVAAGVQAARDRGATFVILSLHWGRTCASAPAPVSAVRPGGTGTGCRSDLRTFSASVSGGRRLAGQADPVRYWRLSGRLCR
jgi:poly-gamma-glutamate synthesis protein (capsule biosynthesis protein)